MSVNYSSIAKEFSKTRQYIWPCISNFLKEINAQKSIFDIGCGNGRNMIYAKSIGFSDVKGIDLCPDLVELCKGKNLDVEIGDMSNLKIDKKYDIVMCVAALHHIQTEESRFQIFCQMFEILNNGGSMIVTMWSDEKRNSKVQKDLNPGDNLVPWKSRGPNPKVLMDRYYYVYTKETLDEFQKKFLKKYPNTNLIIYWEEQNWVITVTK